MNENTFYKKLLFIRFYNNGLIKKFDDMDGCIKSLIGIQTQYQNYALISLINRLNSIEGIFENKNLVKCWGQRTTVHIYHRDDYNIISDLYCKSNNWVYNYFEKLNLDYCDYLNKISEYFEANPKKIINKKDVENLMPIYKSKEVMSWSGIIILASYNKIIYGILNKDNKKIYAKNNIKNNSISVENIIKRYFLHYGPATRKDFLHWSGLKNSKIKEDLDIYLKEKKFLLFKNEKYYYENEKSVMLKNIKFPIILGKFDPLLVSYENKEWILNGFDKKIIWKEAGQIEGVIIFGDGLKATWHYLLKNNYIYFNVIEYVELSTEEKNKIESKFNKVNKILFDKKIRVIYMKEY